MDESDVLRLVQLDSPESSPLFQIDTQNLSQDIFTYLSFISMVMILIMAGLLGPTVTQHHNKTVESDYTHLRSFSISASGFHPFQSEVQFQLRSRDSSYSSTALFTINISNDNKSIPISITLPTLTWVPIYHTRIVNFTDLSLSILFTEPFHLFELRFVTFCDSFGQIRAISIISFLIILYLMKAIQIISGSLTRAHFAPSLLSLATLLFNDPFLILHLFRPSSIWLNIDSVLKDFYIAIVLFFNLYVFERLKISVKTVGKRFITILPIVYFILQLFDDFILTPIQHISYGSQIKEKFLFSPIIVIVLLFYICFFVWNIYKTYLTLEASAEYAFWTYVGYSIVIIIGVICYVGVLQMGISSVRFTFTMAAVNFFTLLVERGHAIPIEENSGYEETGQRENSRFNDETTDLGVAVAIPTSEAFMTTEAIPSQEGGSASEALSVELKGQS
jgi:hypothetical protein